MGESKPIFRQKSLERLSTPDRLDQLLHVVKRRMWIPLLALGGLLVLAVVWCFLGRVPITADALAILVHPGSVVPVQSNASGEIVTLSIEVGDSVKKGALLATLSRPDMDTEIGLQKARRKQFASRAKTLDGINIKSMEREQELIDEQAGRLDARIRSVVERAVDVRDKTAWYNRGQRDRLEETQRLFMKLDVALRGRHESYQELLRDQYTSEDTALGAEQRWYANQLGLADIAVKLQELELREMQVSAAYDRQMDVVADLEIQRTQLALRRHEVSSALEEARLQRETSAEEIQLVIDRLESSRVNQSEIRADYDGTVLEVTVSQGSTIVAGQRIASMAMAEPAEALCALAYFGIADGKKIANRRKTNATMPARVSPVTTQQQTHGSIDAIVVKCSEFPITADAVASQVGNREIAMMLVGDESRIEVTLEFKRSAESKSGFLWTSAGGAGVEISPGTTARVRVTLEERAPITLLIPALRGWFGLE